MKFYGFCLLLVISGCSSLKNRDVSKLEKELTKEFDGKLEGQGLMVGVEFFASRDLNEMQYGEKFKITNIQPVSGILSQIASYRVNNGCDSIYAALGNIYELTFEQNGKKHIYFATSSGKLACSELQAWDTGKFTSIEIRNFKISRKRERVWGYQSDVGLMPESYISDKFDWIMTYPLLLEDPISKWRKNKHILKLITNQKIAIGMPEEALKESWGKPDQINETVVRGRESKQFVFGNSYVYTENGKVSALQLSTDD